MPENQRFKGLYIMPNQEVLGFLQECLDELLGDELGDAIWNDDVADESPAKIVRALKDNGWIYTKDGFSSEKAYRTMHYPASAQPRSTDELRFTVLLHKGVLHLDIRPWGQY